MTSAEVYDLLRVRYCIHNEKLLFKNAVFKIITWIYSTIRKKSPWWSEKGKQIIFSICTISNTGTKAPNYLILCTRIWKKNAILSLLIKYVCTITVIDFFYLNTSAHSLWESSNLSLIFPSPILQRFFLSIQQLTVKKSSPLLPAVLTECICCGHWGCTSSDMLRLLFILACCSFLPCFLKCSWKDAQYKLHNYT